ncbi:8-dihydro-6-hydroxymethylpterin-pyrophosphokinase) (PPPK), partial [Durusdinium trenchii]
SAPELVEAQPPFYNAVVQVDTVLEPAALLRALQAVQARFAKSDLRFGPRELDLDIVAFADGRRVDEPELQVPHVRAHLRDFVVRPLHDLAEGRKVRLGPASASKTVAELVHTTSGAEPVTAEIWSRPGRNWDGDGWREHNDKALVMGILNVTPDSFSDGGRFHAVEDAVAQAKAMMHAGADVVDVGGMSTRPNADYVTAEEEMDRVIPVIEQLRAEEQGDGAFPCALSIDTRKARVAEEAIRAGADIVNDQLGELDDESEEMLAVAGRHGVPLVTMHTRGDTKTMESLLLDPAKHDIVSYVADWLQRRAEAAMLRHAVPRWNIMVDPGLGFAKSAEQCEALLAQVERVAGPDQWPVLIGASRKRFVRQHCTFDIDTTTAATSTAAVLFGANMVRVHDVEAAVDVVPMAAALRRRRQ